MQTNSRLILRIPDIEKELVRMQAEEMGLSMSDYVRWLINLDVGRRILPMIIKEAEENK